MKTAAGNPTTPPTTYETENDIGQKQRLQLNALMNQRMGDAMDLQMQNKLPKERKNFGNKMA
jgi:hypothetical protein